MIGDDISRYRIDSPTRFVASHKKPMSLYTAPKIVLVKTGVRCVAALDADGVVTMQSVYNVRLREELPTGYSLGVHDLYSVLLGILNSRLIEFHIFKTFTAYKLLFPQMNQSTVESIPLPVSGQVLSVGPRLVNAVERVIALHEQVHAAAIGHVRTVLGRQIEATDRQIDRLVYELYGLTDDEVRIVEEATAR